MSVTMGRRGPPNLQQNAPQQPRPPRQGPSQVQIDWTANSVRALGWRSKRTEQAAMREDLFKSFKAAEESAFPIGGADALERQKLAPGKEFKAYLAALKRLENEALPRQGQNAQALRQAAQAYLDHANTAYSAKDLQNQNNIAKMAACRNTLADLDAQDRLLDLRDDFVALGDPPWNSTTAMQAASLKATLDIESVPAGQLESLTAGGGAGVNPAFWVNQASNGGSAKSFLFKPELDEGGSIAGFPRGGEAAREAMTGRAADLLAGMTGLNLKMPETHIVDIGADKLPANALQGKQLPVQNPGKIRGSLQSFARTDGELRQQPGGLIDKVSPEACQTIAILDTITLNLDRHAGNLLITGGTTNDPGLVPIDHGLTFPPAAALGQVGDNLGNNKNALLAMPAAHEPFTPKMLANIGKIDPDVLASAMRKERADLNAVHPNTAGALSDEAIDISRRSAMFLKLAAPTLPPAIVQVALGQNAETLLDPTITDQVFAQRAATVIQAALAQKDATTEYFLMTKEQQSKMIDKLAYNGWPQDNIGHLNQKWMMSDLETALKLYKGNVLNPMVVQELTVRIGQGPLQTALQAGQPLNDLARANPPAHAPAVLDAGTQQEFDDYKLQFPNDPANPTQPFDAAKLGALLDEWREIQQLTATVTLQAACTMLSISPQPTNAADALPVLRQAAALTTTAPGLPPDTDDMQAKTLDLDNIASLVALLPGPAQGQWLNEVQQLRLYVQRGPLLNSQDDPRQHGKAEIRTLRADVSDAVGAHVLAELDRLQQDIPQDMMDDLTSQFIEGARIEARTGILFKPMTFVTQMRRNFGI